jgi:hypothetical protein
MNTKFARLFAENVFTLIFLCPALQEKDKVVVSEKCQQVTIEKEINITQIGDGHF